MSDFPSTPSAWASPTVYATWNACCPAYTTSIVTSTAFTSQTWSVTNRAMYAQIIVPRPAIAYELVWYNGTVVSGTVDCGIFDANLRMLISSGPQTQAGTSVLQKFNITDTAIPPGVYYVGLVQENVTGTTYRTATQLNLLRVSGCGWSAVSGGTLATGPSLSVGSGSELRACGFVARPTPLVLMADFPTSVAITPTHLSSFGFQFTCALTHRLNGAGITAPVSIAWPSANLAMFFPFEVKEPFTVRRVFWCNGSAIIGNTDVGVYTRGGARLTSSGATAQSGGSASTIMYATASPVINLDPGVYLLGMSSSSTTNAAFGHAVTAEQNRMGEMVQMASASPLPIAATFAAGASAGYPLAGVTRLATGF